MFIAAVEQVAMKGRPPRLDDLRLETLSEGLSVQALHIGSYDDEAELLQRMHHEFVSSHRLTMVGRHHEIYLSDARVGGCVTQYSKSSSLGGLTTGLPSAV